MLRKATSIPEKLSGVSVLAALLLGGPCVTLSWADRPLAQVESNASSDTKSHAKPESVGVLDTPAIAEIQQLRARLGHNLLGDSPLFKGVSPGQRQQQFEESLQRAWQIGAKQNEKGTSRWSAATGPVPTAASVEPSAGPATASSNPRQVKSPAGAVKTAESATQLSAALAGARLVRLLRDQARGLDQLADQRERARAYADADQLREIAQQIRMAARSLDHPRDLPAAAGQLHTERTSPTPAAPATPPVE